MPARSALVSTSIFLFDITIVFSMVLSLSLSRSSSACRLCVLLRRWSPGWLGGLICCCLPPHPGLAAVSAGLRALVSWLLAIRLLDVVCLGPISLPPFGFRIAGLPLVDLIGHLWCTCVCVCWVPSLALVWVQSLPASRLSPASLHCSSHGLL